MAKSWIEVSRERLTANYRVCRTLLEREAGPDAAMLAVVKANAYGHGAEICAPVLARTGAEWLGVTDAAEGALVRRALSGHERQPDVLVMCGSFREDAAAMVKHRLTPVVWTAGQMRTLAEAAHHEPMAVHLEVDSGMSRQGVPLQNLEAVLEYLAREPKLRLGGVMTHFASAEMAGAAQTAAQRMNFESAVEAVSKAGLRPTWLHTGNTSALDNGADGGTLRWLRRQAGRLGARPMVRAGLGLYGYALPLEGLVASDGDASLLERGLLPVMAWKTRILSIGEVEAGARIGYNGTFVAERSMRLALLPVGYADGLRRELSSSTKPTHAKAGGWVMISGRPAPVVGRISMNLTTVDVSTINDAAAGDEAILLGDGMTADDHAAVAHTIPYEILCAVRGAKTVTA